MLNIFHELMSTSINFRPILTYLDLAHATVAAGDTILPPCCWASGCMPSHKKLLSSTQISKGAAYRLIHSLVILEVSYEYTSLNQVIHLINYV